MEINVVWFFQSWIHDSHAIAFIPYFSDNFCSWTNIFIHKYWQIMLAFFLFGFIALFYRPSNNHSSQNWRLLHQLYVVNISWRTSNSQLLFIWISSEYVEITVDLSSGQKIHWISRYCSIIFELSIRNIFVHLKLLKFWINSSTILLFSYEI